MKDKLDQPFSDDLLETAIAMVNSGDFDPRIPAILFQGIEADHWQAQGALNKLGRHKVIAFANALVSDKLSNSTKVKILRECSVAFDVTEIMGLSPSSRYLLQREIAAKLPDYPVGKPERMWLNLAFALGDPNSAFVTGDSALQQANMILLALDSKDLAVCEAGLILAAQASSEACNTEVIRKLISIAIKPKNPLGDQATEVLSRHSIPASASKDIIKLLKKNQTRGITAALKAKIWEDRRVLKLFTALVPNDYAELDDRNSFQKCLPKLGKNFTTALVDLHFAPKSDQLARENARSCLLHCVPHDVDRLRGIVDAGQDDLALFAALILDQWELIDESLAEKMAALLCRDNESEEAETARRQTDVKVARLHPVAFADGLKPIISDESRSSETRLEAIKLLVRLGENFESNMDFALDALDRLAVEFEQKRIVFIRGIEHLGAMFSADGEDSEFQSLVNQLVVQGKKRGDIRLVSSGLATLVGSGKKEKNECVMHTSEAIDLMQLGLNCGEREVELDVATSILHLDENNDAAVSVLQKQIKDGHDSMRFAYTALAKARKIPVSDLVSKLDDEDQCYEAIEHIGYLGELARPAVPRLVAMLDTHYDQQVASTLNQLAPHAAAAAPQLLKLLGTEKERHAVKILETIEACAEETVSALIPRLDNKRDMVKTAGLSNRFGYAASPAVQILKKHLTDPDLKSTAIVAARELGKRSRRQWQFQNSNPFTADDDFGKPADPLIPSLVDLLENEETEIVLLAIDSLTTFERNAEAACEPLVRLASSESAIVREEAARAIGVVGGSADVAVPALLQLLDDSSFTVRRNAVRSLRTFGEDAQSAVEKIVECATPWQHDEAMIYPAVDTLGAIGPAAKLGLPILTCAYKTGWGDWHTWDLHMRAANAIKMVDPDTAKSLGIWDAPNVPFRTCNGILGALHPNWAS